MPNLKVLIVEDNDDDCLLLVEELRYGGFDQLKYECVKTAAELERTLSSQPWDIVLSDYSLPGFNGLEALAILKQSQLDIPFVLVSGAIGEELAVKAVKEGVNDYLLKDKLFRLATVVRRELNEAKQRNALKEAQEQLVLEKQKAEMANQRKSQVLTFVAHEFKNPINAVLLHADLLHKGVGGTLTPEQTAFVENIQTGTRLLQDLVADILDIGAIEAGHIDIHKQETNVQTIVDEVNAIIAPIAQRKTITLDFFNTLNNQTIMADARRLKQILINLLSNAVKYTPEGGQVKLSVSHPVESPTSVAIAVEDNGVGLNSEELSQLFNEYYRAYNLLTTQSEGIGLGLAVTRKLVELHQGKITVDSEPGKGTCFTVVLPQ